jgi:hypothetical protein
VRIEMYADALVHGPPFRVLMSPRAVPRETVGAIRLEVPLITWLK